MSTIFKEVISLRDNKVYLISKSFESKIADILSYLLEDNNTNQIKNKIEILNYLEELFKAVDYNSEIFLSKSSYGKNILDIFEIIIHEFILNTKQNSKEDTKSIKEYHEELKNIFSILLSKISLDKKTYHYIFSFLINYMNKKDNDIENDEKLNPEHISNVIELLQIFYQYAQNVDEPYNYFYFNNFIENNEENKSEYIIKIKNRENLNRKKILNLDDSFNILIFIKLVPDELKKGIEINQSHYNDLFELKFADQSKNISFNIDYGNYLTNNISDEKIIKLEENKYINILFKFILKESLKIEIYIDNKKIDFKNDQIPIKDSEKQKIKEKYEITSIDFFRNFLGECSNIILFKNKKNEGIPRFFLEMQTVEKKKPTSMTALFDDMSKNKNNKNDKNASQELLFKKEYKNGIFNEDLFNILLKSELRDDVDPNLIEKLNKNKDKTPINDIKEFMDKIIAIYMPSRIEIPEEDGNKNIRNSPSIILKDSINNLDGIFIKSKLDDENISNLNGIHLFNSIIDDMNNLGGLNHLIPIIELLSKYSEELLTTENICRLFNLITLIFVPNYRNSLKNEKFSNFFFNLSYFLEKIPDKYYNNELCDNIINLSQILLSLMSDDNYSKLNSQYQNYILFNEKLLYKYEIPEKNKILEQIKSVLNSAYSNNKGDDLNMDIMKIINILLYFDKDIYNKFCCKEHKEYFTSSNTEIMSPELKEVIKPLKDILKLFFKKYNIETQLIIKDNKNSTELSKTGYDLINLFEILTMNISPCLQKMIIELFFEFLHENINQAYKHVNLIDKDGKIFNICLFVLKASIFDIKLDVLNLIYLLSKMKNNLTKSDTSNIKNKNDKNEKEIMPSVSLSGLKEIFMNNYIIPYYLFPKEELKNIKMDKIKKNFYINGLQYNYINKSEIENKLFINYDKQKLNALLLDIYKNIYKPFKESLLFQLNLNLLVKIVSKGDIPLNILFLQHLTQEKNKFNEICQNQVLVHYLLETYFQGYIIKSTNYDKNKFISKFYFSENLKEIKNEIDLINKLSNELLINIFKKNIYKLDYLLTWSKYYHEICLNNSKISYETFKEFIYNILIEVDKNKMQKEIVIVDRNNAIHNSAQREGLYFINILFELVSYFKYFPIKKGNEDSIKINEDNNIYDELNTSFNTILSSESKEKDNMNKSLKIKWKYFSLFKKIYLYFSSLWSKIIKEENDVYGKYIENKKDINIYIAELEVLFYSFDDIPEFNDYSKKIVNKGVQVIYILYHYFILLFNFGGDKEDIKETINEFRQFLTLLIIGSCTLSTDIDKKKRKWPTAEQYQNVQLIVKNILYNSFHFFYTNIKKYNEILESNKNLSENEKDYYLYIKNILYETFGYLLKIINRIYRQIKKEEDKNSNHKGFRTGIKGMFSKVKGFFSDSEGVKTSGPYLLFDKLYTNIELDTSYNTKNYLDNIPHVDFKTKDIKCKSINNKIEESINSFIKETKLKVFFEAINKYSKEEEELSKNKLYPFLDYIKKRSLLLNSFIPFYDNLPNVDMEVSDEKNIILKKVCLVSDYYPECIFDKSLEKNIKEMNKELNKRILLTINKEKIEKRTNIYYYIKDKKKLFSFLGLWSNEDFFYKKDKYDLKYKLVNHLTDDYTRVLFKPILNLDYYLPEFSKFNYDKLFRKIDKKSILYLTDLSFFVKEHKTPLITNEDEGENKTNEKDKENNKNDSKNDCQNENYNILYDIKLNNYKELENISLDKETLEKDISSELFSEYIKQKYLYNSTQFDLQVESCLIRSSFHINGIFFNNAEGIGFYSHNKIFKENDEEFDNDRQTCFGSTFRRQNKKYDYYYIKIPYNSISFILKRKYFYKKSSIEVFTVNKKSYLFKLEDNKIKTMLDNIKHYMKSNIEDIYIEYSKYDDKIGFYNKQTFLNLNNGYIPLPTTQIEMNLKNIYEKWSKWKLSTLNLLMMINLYSNRTYNDLNQYPVFPWIITDYSSSKLKEENNLIRPFDTPMGMLDITEKAKERKENYIEHWKSSEDDKEKEENYDRYRSHYSTSLYTTYYLVRVFPYSSLRIELQGKNFDDPNRLFNSLSASFDNAITQKADLRELIPEFYCLPEIFYNKNNLNLGNILDDEEKPHPVGDISLPPWSSEDGYIFINKHRELLESPEVNDKINEWFNIIFGSKQKGKEARKINNLFMNHSYEDFEEQYKKSNLEEKKYLCKLVEFGITPNQVFKNDAYKRTDYNELKNKRQLLPNMTQYLKQIENNKEIENDIAKELVIDETGFHIFGVPYKLEYSELGKDKTRIYAVTQDKIKAFRRITEKVQIKKAVANNNENQNENDNKDEYIMKLNLEQKKEIKLNLPRYRIENSKGPIVFYNNGRNVSLGGYWNGNILVQNLEENEDKKIKVKKTSIHFTHENSPIIKMVIDKSDTFVICGNTLGTIYIFIINQNNKSEWTLYKKIKDHYSEITSLSINENLNMFISCSRDGYCMIYALPSCKLINSFRITDNLFNSNNNTDNRDNIYYPNISIISNSPLPLIIFYIGSRNSLSVFSINGHFIKEEKIDFKINENGIKKFTDTQFKDYLLIYNSNKNCIEVYNIIDLKNVLSLPLIGHTFIDFIWNNELDHILILVKYKGKNEEKNNEQISSKTTYKILVMRNPNCEIEWK